MKEICVIEGDGFRELVGKLDAILEAFGTYKKNEKQIATPLR